MGGEQCTVHRKYKESGNIKGKGKLVGGPGPNVMTVRGSVVVGAVCFLPDPTGNRVVRVSHVGCLLHGPIATRVARRATCQLPLACTRTEGRNRLC